MNTEHTHQQLDKLTIRGFKSIRELNDFELHPLNIFVGANGAGKSNLISFFRLLRSLMEDNLGDYIIKNGGIGDVLFNGRKATDKMFFETMFGLHGYRFTIRQGADDKNFAVTDEARLYKKSRGDGWWLLGSSVDDKSLLAREIKRNLPDSKYSRPIHETICSWKIYHFHDTSATASMRHAEIIQDNETLRPDASNIAPFLLKLREEDNEAYQDILNTCRMVVPYLDDFLLKPEKFGQAEKVSLTWRTKGADFPMQPYHLSDGSIRFICLATALLQPVPPSAIIIDEPELGLHPEAIRILGELIQNAAKRTQLIIATQSPLLLDQFSINDIVVANHRDGQSVFERLKQEDFSAWLENFSVGELWTQNVIQGGTNHE